MAWSSLGIKQPGFIWQDFDTAVLGDVAVRVTQTYSPSEVSFLNKIQLSEFYATGERRFLKTLYPTTDPRVFAFSIPQPLKDAGYVTRYFSVRHGYYGVADVANWTINLEVWLP